MPPAAGVDGRTVHTTITPRGYIRIILSFSNDVNIFPHHFSAQPLLMPRFDLRKVRLPSVDRAEACHQLVATGRPTMRCWRMSAHFAKTPPGSVTSARKPGPPMQLSPLRGAPYAIGR